MLKRLFITPAIAITLVSGCGGGEPLDAAATAQIDCLAAKTVTRVSDTVRDGLLAGKTPDELSAVETEERSAALSDLSAAYPSAAATAYFNTQVSERLEAIEAAVREPNGAPEAHSKMYETQNLAANCSFG